MALQRLTLNNAAASVAHFTHAGGRGEFNLDPPYQRGHVWGEQRKRELIRSILLGLPIGAIIVNVRGIAFETHGIDEPYYSVIDGKQRITAIHDFIDGHFTVPADWFADTDVPAGVVEVRFPDLAISARRSFTLRPVSLIEASVPTVEEEEEIFNLINFGGLAQGETDADL